MLLLSVTALTAASLLLLYPTSAHAQGGVPLWTNLFKGPTHGGENPAVIATDAGGNVFVTGLPTTDGLSATIKYSSDGVPLWTNLSGASRIAVDRSDNVFVTGNAATIKYSNVGVPLWTNQLGGFAGAAIAVDGNGTVFVTGWTDTGSATISYSNAGVPLWTNRYTGALGAGLGGGIAVDSGGNVFVTGTIANSSSGSDYVTIKYSNAGVAQWTNSYTGPGNNLDFPWAIAVDSRDNVCVTGYSRSNSTDGQAASDYATVAYSNSGVPLWTNRYNGPANRGDEGLAIAVDPSGNFFVTGPSVTVRDFISDPADYATIKYSNSGVPLWTNRYDGPAGQNELANAIAVDSSGNVFVTGFSVNDPNFPVSSDYATVAYSNAGELLWENRYNGPDNLLSWPQAIAVDRAGNVFVTGYTRYSDGYSYYTTIKYSSSLPPPVHLDFQVLNNELVLSWTNTGFNLETAPAVTGPFTNILGATSPYTNAATSAQQFFRLIGN